jgi:hypothetical protein
MWRALRLPGWTSKPLPGNPPQCRISVVDATILFTSNRSVVTFVAIEVDMRRSLLSIITSTLLLIATATSSAKNPKVVPEAPMPDSVATAKKVFLTNGGGSPLAFDEFYAKMKIWGRYTLVGSPSESDVVMELRYFVEDLGTKVSSYTNTYTGQTQITSHKVTDPQLQINIYDAKTKDLLWSVIDHRRLAIREKNREKETINSADRLVEGMQARLPSAGPLPPFQHP